jgi:ribosomal protein S18 acetylase RimI-like enzyme
VAEAGGEIVGAVIAAWDGWRGTMYRLAVLGAYRRRGVGSRLVRAGHEFLAAQGARRVCALGVESEGQATAFWRAAGYEHDGRIARYVTNL